LERLPDHAEDLPLESIRSALHGVYNAADRLLGLDDEPVDWLAAANDILISRFAFRLLERLSEPERYRLLLELVQSAKALGVIVYELTLLGQEQGRYGTSGGLPSDQWAITEEHLNALEKAALKRIRSMSRNEPRELLPFRKLASLMYRWREWGKLPEVRRWATRVVVDDDALLRLLEEFLVLGSANGRRTYAVRVNSLREFFDPNKVADRVRFLASDPEIDKWKHVAAQEFVRSYDGKGSGSD